jgi:hypothetical protein
MLFEAQSVNDDYWIGWQCFLRKIGLFPASRESSDEWVAAAKENAELE